MSSPGPPWLAHGARAHKLSRERPPITQWASRPPPLTLLGILRRPCRPGMPVTLSLGQAARAGGRAAGRLARAGLARPPRADKPPARSLSHPVALSRRAHLPAGCPAAHSPAPSPPIGDVCAACAGRRLSGSNSFPRHAHPRWVQAPPVQEGSMSAGGTQPAGGPRPPDALRCGA